MLGLSHVAPDGARARLAPTVETPPAGAWRACGAARDSRLTPVSLAGSSRGCAAVAIEGSGSVRRVPSCSGGTAVGERERCTNRQREGLATMQGELVRFNPKLLELSGHCRQRPWPQDKTRTIASQWHELVRTLPAPSLSSTASCTETPRGHSCPVLASAQMFSSPTAANTAVCDLLLLRLVQCEPGQSRGPEDLSAWNSNATTR